MSWTEERIDDLRRLWDAGYSASAIGKQIGMSKNAVIGKAHRLGLRARPSPIRRSAPKPILTGRIRLEEPRTEPAPPPPPVRPRRIARGSTCLWPIGDPGDTDFRFCEEPVAEGKPYCAEHCAKAYIARRSGETAAA